MKSSIKSLILILIFASINCYADACGDKEDHTFFVTGKDQCLVIRAYGSYKPKTMVVWLHGDVTSGGPANYHFSIAKKTISKLETNDVLSIAMIRPGYSDGEGRESSAGFFQKPRRKGDDYQKWVIFEIADAIENLKRHFRPDKVILIGHSGGAAIAANILGMAPKLIDGSILVSCPCDMRALYRAQGWNATLTSEDPIERVSSVDENVKVFVLTGDLDVLTLPKFAQSYVDALVQRGIDAKFSLIKDTPHNGALGSELVYSKLKDF